MAKIEIIQPDQATGELQSIYEDLVKTRGKVAEVHKIQSLNPKSIVNHMDLYMTIMFGKSPLKRVQREMMAVVVSKENDCEYCQVHHAEAVQNFWKDEEKTNQLKEDFSKIELSEVDYALCEYAKKVTSNPGLSNNEDLTTPLRNLGLEDRAILDATLVISYFNFVNRIVLTLGVELEENPGGYKYE